MAARTLVRCTSSLLWDSLGTSDVLEMCMCHMARQLIACYANSDSSSHCSWVIAETAPDIYQPSRIIWGPFSHGKTINNRKAFSKKERETHSQRFSGNRHTEKTRDCRVTSQLAFHTHASAVWYWDTNSQPKVCTYFPRRYSSVLTSYQWNCSKATCSEEIFQFEWQCLSSLALQYLWLVYSHPPMEKFYMLVWMKYGISDLRYSYWLSTCSVWGRVWCLFSKQSRIWPSWTFQHWLRVHKQGLYKPNWPAIDDKILSRRALLTSSLIKRKSISSE